MDYIDHSHVIPLFTIYPTHYKERKEFEEIFATTNQLFCPNKRRHLFCLDTKPSLRLPYLGLEGVPDGTFSRESLRGFRQYSQEHCVEFSSIGWIDLLQPELYSLEMYQEICERSDFLSHKHRGLWDCRFR